LGEILGGKRHQSDKGQSAAETKQPIPDQFLVRAQYIVANAATTKQAIAKEKEFTHRARMMSRPDNALL